MKNCIIAFLTTIVFSFLAMLIDANIGLDGNFSIVTAIATMGSFLIYFMTRTNKS